MYILKVYSIHYKLRSNTNVKHLLSFFRQNDTKNVLLFLSRAPTRHSFPFNSWFLYELKRKVRLTKPVFDIFHFRFCFVFIKVYIFVQQNADSLTLKHHNFSQKWNNKKATHSFAPRPLIFKLQQELLKFIDICVSWSLNLENRSFENASFSQ